MNEPWLSLEPYSSRRAKQKLKDARELLIVLYVSVLVGALCLAVFMLAGCVTTSTCTVNDKLIGRC